MRKMNAIPKSHRWIPAVLLLVLALACGSVFAYMFQQTKLADTTFIPAMVACDSEKILVDTSSGSKVDQINVKSTSSIGAYVRVRLVTYWVDALGNIAPKSSPDLDVDPASGWLPGKNDTFYYYKPIDDALVRTLLDEAIPMAEDGPYHQVLDVFVEAIQADPPTAVTTSWGVTLKSDGTIDTVPTA